MVLCHAHSTAPVSLVARHCRVLERSRFRGAVGSERAREHAFQQLELADRAPEDQFHEMEYEEVGSRLSRNLCRAAFCGCL